MQLKKAIEKKLCEYDEIIMQAEKQLAELPKGSIRVSISEGRTQYYMRTAEDLVKRHYNGQYLSRKKKEMIPALCSRRYWQEVYEVVRKQQESLKRFVSGYDMDAVKNIYLTLPESIAKHIQPLDLSDDQYIESWLADEYEKKPFAEGTSEIYSDHGERVRSKSEKIIADMLAANNIPYKYEKPLRLHGGAVIHPDFTLLSVVQRKEYYLEHLGLMDDPQYAAKAVQRIYDYGKNGIFPGQKLLLSFETSRKVLDVRLLQKMIFSVLK